MNKPTLEQLTHDLKKLIIDECDKSDDIEIDEFTDDLPLFGPKSPLALDSLDTLQISMAIQKTYGVRIEGAGEVRNAMPSVQVLAQFILDNQA
jgi:acyl carrier protein